MNKVIGDMWGYTIRIAMDQASDQITGQIEVQVHYRQWAAVNGKIWIDAQVHEELCNE